ncbi:MAG: trimeric autotransporter adhesin [Verrucomicrobiota bacterium]|jgi:N-acetylneuraminic acid mutarotase
MKCGSPLTAAFPPFRAKPSVLLAITFLLGVASISTLCGSDEPIAFGNTGSLNIARRYYTATLLPNGKVLVAGGDNNSGETASAELYDPANGTWTVTGSLHFKRSQHTATLLSNGKVLVAGGFDGSTGTNVASAELYDPATGAWTVTGSLNSPRETHTATLLTNGKVLVAGGESYNNESYTSTASAELYDPATGTWTVTGNLSSSRLFHTATLLANGKVLVAGGQFINGTSIASTELYDPANGTWTVTGNLTNGRSGHTANLLPDGKVLVAGGNNLSGNTFNNPASTELYDPANGTWTVTGNLNNGRSGHTANLLPNGKVLLVAGETVFGTALTSNELYNPLNGAWSVTGSLNTARYYHTATLLPNGEVLVAGGETANGIVLASAELSTSTYPSWSDWQGVHFTDSQINDLSVSGFDADPDLDGVPNAFEFYFNFDPNVSLTSAERAALPSVGLQSTSDNNSVSTYLTFTYRRRIESSGFPVKVSVSDDLLTWDDSETQIEPVGTPIPTGDNITETVTVRLKTPINQGPITHKFFRLKLAFVHPPSASQWAASAGGNDHWYEVLQSPALTWPQARNFAADRGGYLAAITSSAEDQFVKSLFPEGLAAVIGGYRDDLGWHWLTGEPFTFTDWAAGEPNNAGGVENCIQFIGSDGTWNDGSQTANPYSFVIEYSK